LAPAVPLSMAVSASELEGEVPVVNLSGSDGTPGKLLLRRGSKRAMEAENESPVVMTTTSAQLSPGSEAHVMVWPTSRHPASARTF